MKPFGKKRAESGDSSHASAEAANSSKISHRFTLNLARAMDMAAMLASSRASQFIEIPDFLAGVYLYEWERISEYWPEENHEQVEDVLREICQISPQRWNYWIQLYDQRRRESEPQSNWEKLIKTRRKPKNAEPPSPSLAFRKAIEAAERLTPFRDRKHKDENAESDDFFERGVPVLTTECLLLSIVKHTLSDSGRKLAGSGLDIEKLEHAALDPRRSPLR